MSNITKKEIIQSFAQLLPDGLFWEAKNIPGSNLYKLISGLCENTFRLQQEIKMLEDHYVPTLQNLSLGIFYKEWLRAVKLPDECDGFLDDVNFTLLNAFARISGLNKLYNSQSYRDFAAFFGITLQIAWPAPYTIHFTLTGTTTGGFPYTFPLVFGGVELSIIKCIFEKSVPYHYKLTFTLLEIPLKPTITTEEGNPILTEDGIYHITLE